MDSMKFVIKDSNFFWYLAWSGVYLETDVHQSGSQIVT